MTDAPVTMICHSGPLDGISFMIAAGHVVINLPVPPASAEQGATLARYRVGELVSNPGTPALIFDEDEEGRPLTP